MAESPVILLINPLPDADTWRRLIAVHDPEAKVRVWPDLAADEAVDVIVGFTVREEHRRILEKARLIIVPGAGVDGVVRTAPADVTISRVIDSGQAMSMTQYITASVLKYVRRFDDYTRQQRQLVWQRQKSLPGEECRVGILGLGTLGEHAAKILSGLGIDVLGWSRSRKAVPGVECHAGEAELEAFLAKSNILICLLPLTQETRGILDARRLAMLPRGARLVNVGRGEQLVEDDLRAALDTGHVVGATLDVCSKEPLPTDHWLWTHPLVDLTPHIGGTLRIEDNVEQVMDHVRRFRMGLPALNVVDRSRGY